MVQRPTDGLASTCSQDMSETRRRDVRAEDARSHRHARDTASVPPVGDDVRGSRDFGKADALADALLNPRDRSYSVPQLFEFIERRSDFWRWFWQAPYLPQCGAIATSPHHARLTALAAPEHMLRSTVARFNGSTQSNRWAEGHRARARAIQFDGDRWRSFVPIRLPNTLCIQERLPPGAVGVLLNQSHTHTDSVLPIDELEEAAIRCHRWPPLDSRDCRAAPHAGAAIAAGTARERSSSACGPTIKLSSTLHKEEASIHVRSHTMLQSWTIAVAVALVSWYPHVVERSLPRSQSPRRSLRPSRTPCPRGTTAPPRKPSSTSSDA